MGKYSFIFIILFLVPSLGWAKDESAEEKKAPIVCHGDKVEFLEARKRLAAEGKVLVIYEDIKITCDVKPSEQWATMGELRLRLKKAVDIEGIEIPWPHRKIYFGNSMEDITN